MALVYADRVKESSTTTGTGTLTLAGAVTGFRTFASALGANGLVTYTLEDGTAWEVGEGTFTLSGTTLSRTTILASSNAGAAVNWSAGTRSVYLVLAARDVSPGRFTDVAKSANYTIVSGDKGATFVCTNSITLTLPTAADKFWFGVYNNGVGMVTVGSTIRLLPGEWASLASDGSGWFVLDARLDVPLISVHRPPVTANAEDDEFQGTSLDGKWTQVNWGSGLTATFSGGSMRVLFTTASSATIRTILQAIPAGDFSVTMPLSLSTGTGSYTYHGLVLSDGTTAGAGKHIVASIVHDTTDFLSLYVQQGTNFSGVATTLFGPSKWSDRDVFLRVSRVAGAWSFAASHDGEQFTTAVAFTPSSMTPTYMGIGFMDNGTPLIAATVPWFRRT